MFDPGWKKHRGQTEKGVLKNIIPLTGWKRPPKVSIKKLYLN